MEYIIVTLFVIFIGFSIAGCMFTKEIDIKERRIANQEAKIKSRDILIDDQCRKINRIKSELKKQQFGSVENLKNKIKTILFPSDQTSK